MQDVRNVGPLPRGFYTIGAWSMDPRPGELAKLGPVTAELDPDPGNETFGRSGFFIHGPEFSEGCIVLPHGVRVQLATSSDRRLQVIE